MTDAIRETLASKFLTLQAERDQLRETLNAVRFIAAGWLLPGSTDSAQAMARIVAILDENSPERA